MGHERRYRYVRGESGLSPTPERLLLKRHSFDDSAVEHDFETLEIKSLIPPGRGTHGYFED